MTQLSSYTTKDYSEISNTSFVNLKKCVELAEANGVLRSSNLEDQFTKTSKELIEFKSSAATSIEELKNSLNISNNINTNQFND